MRKAIQSSAAAAIGAVLLSAGFAQAANHTFIPGVGPSPGSVPANPAGTGNWNDPNNWVSPVGTNAGVNFGVPDGDDLAGSATGATTILDSVVPTVNEVRWGNAEAGGAAATIGGTAIPAAGAGATLNVLPGGSLTSRSIDGTSNGTLLFGRSSTGTATILNMSGGSLTANSAAAITNDTPGTMVIGSVANATGASTANFTFSGGTVTLANNYIVGAESSRVTSNNTLARATGNVTQSGGSITAAGNVAIANNGIATYNMSAGSLTQAGTSILTSGINRDAFFVGRNSGSNGTFNQSGTATVSVANGMYIGNASAGTIGTAPNIVNTPAATGTYTISGGTLTIAGQLFVGATQNAGGNQTLTGNSGTFRIIGNDAATITANELRADGAGSTLGFVMDDASGTSLLSITPGSVTQVNTAGGGTVNTPFAGSATFVSGTLIDIDAAIGFTPSAATVFELVRAASINTLPTLVGDGDAFDAYTLSIRDNGNGTSSLIAAVPEPASLAVIGLGGLMLMGRRRRS